jgi:hypothetical protein
MYKASGARKLSAQIRAGILLTMGEIRACSSVRDCIVHIVVCFGQLELTTINDKVVGICE